MPFKAADVQAEYAKNKHLKEEDVQALQQWAEKQPHLPALSELQLILFLQSCYFRIEAAKATIELFYTIRTHCPDFFSNRDPCSTASKEFMNVTICTLLPKPTPEGYRIIYGRLMDTKANNFIFSEQVKSFDMLVMLCLIQEGTAEGLLFIVDMKGVALGHLTRLGIMTVKKFLYYLQEAVPIRLLGIHFINVVPFIDKVVAIIKPFMKKELVDMLHFHTDSMESLYPFVPKECLPKDYGGSVDSIATLHEKMKNTLMENAEYFNLEEQQIVDEFKRPGKPKNIGDIFGVEGSFKKLDID